MVHSLLTNVIQLFSSTVIALNHFVTVEPTNYSGNLDVNGTMSLNMGLASSNPLKVSGCANLHGHLLMNISGNPSPGSFLILNSTCLDTSDLSLEVSGTNTQCYSSTIQQTASGLSLITLPIDSIQCNSSILVPVVAGSVSGAVVITLILFVVIYFTRKRAQIKIVKSLAVK